MVIINTGLLIVDINFARNSLAKLSLSGPQQEMTTFSLINQRTKSFNHSNNSWHNLNYVKNNLQR
jgi:hypothetical protein